MEEKKGGKKIIADCTPGSLPGLRKKNLKKFTIVEVLKPPTYQIKQTE